MALPFTRRARFERLLRPEYAALGGLALRLTRDPVAAEDLLQEALLTGLRRIDQLREAGAFRLWMSRILVRTWQNRGARKIDTVIELREVRVACEDSPARHLQRRQLAERMSQAFDALPEPQRVAVLLVDGQGFRFAEAADILDTRPGTVASRVARGRAALRDALGDVARAEGVIQ